MPTIDELGAEAAQRLRSEMAAIVDAGAGLRRLDATRTRPVRSPERLRRVGLIAAAAVIVIGVAGLVVIRGRGSHDRPAPPAVSNPVATDTAPPTAPVTREPPTAPSTPSSEVTNSSVLAEAPSIPVSYRSLPPAFVPEVFATVPLPASGAQPRTFPTEVAVARDGAVVIDRIGGVAHHVSFDGTVGPPITLPDDLSSVVVDGNGVLYGIGPSAQCCGLALLALSLDTGATATEIDRVDISSAAFVELPTGALGLGPTGIVARVRQIGAQLRPYVLPPAAALPSAVAHPATIDAGDLVRSVGGPSWQLAIERAAGWPGDPNGSNAPAPSADGYVYWTTVGPPVKPDVDFPQPTLPVIADLHLDGTGTWWSLTDGWEVASSDVWGTVLMRVGTDHVDLARFPTAAPAVGTISGFVVSDVDVSGFVDAGLPACAAETCPQFAWRSDGTRLRLDSDGTFTIGTGADADATTVRWSTSPPAGTSLVAYGPGDVAYLDVPSPDAVDPIGDLLAVALAGPLTGDVVLRNQRVTDRSGDSRLVAGANGLVVVGCCGMDPIRPAPDAAVSMVWVDTNGDAVVNPDPISSVQIGSTAMTVVRTPADGFPTRWSVPIQLVTGLRDMPSIFPAADGSVIVAWDDWTSATQPVIRVDATGAVSRLHLGTDARFLGLDGDGRILAWAAGRIVSAPLPAA